ncbi:MAG: Txe/YoeB family addiction module toxin [Synergistaceae bacterium]|nr:Txe/YoeB family addiction module toxin [Synergistaceae bacterium]
MIKSWGTEAWEDYIYWQGEDRRILKRINTLLRDIERNGHEGMGKAEPLKGNFSGYWSRRIDEEHRLIYALRDDQIIILSCRYHYNSR